MIRHHLLADLADLPVPEIGGLFDLVGALLCKSHAEGMQRVAVSGPHIYMGFKLLGQVHNVEVRGGSSFPERPQ